MTTTTMKITPIAPMTMSMMSRPNNSFSTIDYFAVAGPLTTAGVVNCIKGN